MNDQPHYPDEEEVEHAGDRDPAPSGGGLTSATGALTPDATGTDPFIPGELREIEDATQGARMTEAMARHAEEEEETNTEPPDHAGREGPTVMAQESGGYGSTHGLAADDPAYRLDRAPDPTPRSSGPRLPETDTYGETEEHY
jgi:hypothetical protein